MAVWLVLQRDQEILLLKRSNTGYMDGYYTLIAGHVEQNEGPTNAMLREAYEEAGISLNTSDVSFTHITYRKFTDRKYINLFFSAKNVIVEPYNKEPDKCSEMKWFHLSHLPKKIDPNVKKAIDAIQSNQLYLESGW